MLEGAFLQVLNMSLISGIVIVIVLEARLWMWLWPVPKIYPHLLWGVALFRLVCPFSFESAFSLLPGKAKPIPADIGLMRAPQIELGVGPVDRVINAVLPAPIDPTASVNPMQVWLAVGSILWVVGAALLLLFAVVSLARLKQRLRPAVHEQGNIWVLPGLETPFVLGVFSPRIYLPAGCSEEERRYLLLHEKTHIRRGDHLIRLVWFLALCVHWFNPLAWLAFSLSGRDIEMSCDERVIQELGSAIKKEYSGSLLSFATGRRFFGATPLAFGEGDTRARIKNILNYRRPTVWVSVGTAVVVAVIAALMLANPKETGEPLGNFVVSESLITLPDGSRATTQLVLLEGRRFDGEAAGLGGGIAPGENFGGRCELRLLVGDRVISTLSLAQEGQNADGMLFSQRGFPIRFADYNQDGNPDFSIGQWGSSNADVFSLFTLRDGAIERISGPLSVTSSEGKGGQEYSIVFTAQDHVIETFVYDNNIGENRPVSYLWDEASGRFIAGEDPLGAEKAFITALLGSVKTEGGNLEFTIPSPIPTVHRLYLQVSGIVPTEDHSHMSIHAFQRESDEGLWEAGKTYRTALFPQTPPDTTEIYVDVSFSDQSGIQLCGGVEKRTYQGGVAVFTASPLDTKADVS